MPTKHTLTGSFADLLGISISGKRLTVTLNTNLGSAALSDHDNNEVLPPGPVPVSLTGASFSLELIATNSTGINVTDGSLRYIVHAEYRDSSNRKRTWNSGYFPLTADADLSDVIGTAFLPPTFASEKIAEMEALLAEAEVITGLTGEDEAVALLVNTPGTDTATALEEKIGEEVAPVLERRVLTAVNRETVVFPGRKTLTVAGEDFYIKGVNLGLISGSFFDSWTTQWGQVRFEDALEDMGRAGFNTVRIVGHFRAYLDDPALYKTRLHSLFEKAREVGLKVVYSFLNNATSPNDYLNWGMYQDAYKAMFTDLAGDYIGDNLILIWDVGNELHAAGGEPTVAAMLEIISNFAPWIKTQDPTGLVTASQAISGLYEEAFAKIDAVEPYVDVQALHIYLTPSILHTGKGAFQAWCDRTQKPLYFNEVGANSANAAGGPHVGGLGAQASFMAMMRRHMIDSDSNGILFWKAFNSTGSNAMMGMWDGAGDPTPQLDEAMRFPDRHLTAVRDYVEARPHVVLIDNFDRDASTTVLGSPDIGPAPTIVSGTWGIKSGLGGGGYPATKAGSTSDKVVWDCKTRHTPLFEAEFRAVTNLADFAIIWHYTDASNFWFLRFHRMTTPATDNQYSIVKVVDGTSTTVVNAVLPGLADADHERRVRLGVRLRYDGTVAKSFAYPYAYGIALPRVDITTGPAPTTKRGVLISSSDGASYVNAVRAYVEGQIAP